MRATITASPQQVFPFPPWFSALSWGEVSKGRKCGLGVWKSPGLSLETQGFLCVGVAHLYVTSIWIMKLERKTRKVQAA